MRADREVVLTAISNDSLTIRSASEEFQVDPDIVLTALLSWSDDERFFFTPSCDDVVVINDGDGGDDSYSSMGGGGKMMMMDGLIRTIVPAHLWRVSTLRPLRRRGIRRTPPVRFEGIKNQPRRHPSRHQHRSSRDLLDQHLVVRYGILPIFLHFGDSILKWA